VAPERCLKISTAICRCLSNDDISNSIRAIAAINPPSTTGGSLLGLAGNSSDAVANVAGSPATPSPAAVLLRYSLDHLRNDRMLTPSSLARSFAGTPRARHLYDPFGEVASFSKMRAKDFVTIVTGVTKGCLGGIGIVSLAHRSPIQDTDWATYDSCRSDSRLVDLSLARYTCLSACRSND
jgi:hypothetical protein